MCTANGPDVSSAVRVLLYNAQFLVSQCALYNKNIKQIETSKNVLLGENNM